MAKELKVEWATGGTEHTGIESQVFSDNEDINIYEWEEKLLERAAKKICWGSRLIRVGTILSNKDEAGIICKGENCSSVNGSEHSDECIKEHELCVAGKLNSAYQDRCVNYEPDKSKETGVRSVKLGMIYDCSNYEDEGNAPYKSCYFCKNMKDD